MADPVLLVPVLEHRARADYEGARREALRTLRRLEPEAEAQPRDLFELLLELGRLHQDLGDADEAEATFVRSLSVAEKTPEAKSLRAAGARPARGRAL
jgi:Flp pilus assembly protein TadD